jgi:hypothetical protein
MNRKQLNYQAMLESVAALLGLRAADLAVNPLIADNAAILNNILKALRDLKQVQDKTTKGATRAKSEIEKDMTEGIFMVGAALRGYATEAKNYEMLAMATFAESDITHMRESDLADKARTIYEAAEPISAELNIYQVVPETIANLRTNHQDFLAAMNGGRNILVQTKQSTADIESKIAEGLMLLKEKLDVHMLPFKRTNPTLYGEYKNARVIIDRAASHDTKGEISIQVLDGTTGNPIVNADAKATKKGGSDVTKSVKRSETDGMLRFPPFDPGEYDFEVSADGYVTGTGTFVIRLGEETELTVRLRKS